MALKPSNSSVKQPLPHVMALMFQNRIRAQHIHKETGIAYETVCKALDPARFASLGYGRLMLVRGEVEKRLRSAGWQGEAKDLWEEFEQAFAEEMPKAEAA